MAPPAIASVLADELNDLAAEEPGPIASAEAAGPGFLNLRFADGALEVVDRAIREPPSWGRLAAALPARRRVGTSTSNSCPPTQRDR